MIFLKIEDVYQADIPEQAELWLSRKGKHIDILGFTYHGWQDYKVIMIKPLSILYYMFETLSNGHYSIEIHLDIGIRLHLDFHNLYRRRNSMVRRFKRCNTHI